MMKNKKIILISSIVFILLITLLVLFLVFKKNKINKNIDEEKIKFAEEYKTTKDNVFTYRTIEEINKILKNTQKTKKPWDGFVINDQSQGFFCLTE